MKVHPTFFKDISEKDLVTRAGRLGGCRYNRFSLQVESVYSDYLRVAILGNVRTSTSSTRTAPQRSQSVFFPRISLPLPTTVGLIFNVFEVLHVMYMYDIPYIAII
jgi:hypothetical protein